MSRNKWLRDGEDLHQSLSLSPYVFVYGTLRRGYGNNRLFGDNTEFVCTTQTVEPMFMSGKVVPYVATKDQALKQGVEVDEDFWLPVRGEVFRLAKGDTFTLCNLDWLEGHPDNYRREIVTLESGHEAWMYLNPYAFWMVRGDIEGRVINNMKDGVYQCK